jgi:hypothetical protein
MAYLDDHKPARAQFSCPRRATPSGVIVVHTAENFPDMVPADGGAEAIAAFTARRTDKAGSYHDVCDSDSIVNLVRYSCEAFHVATYNMNWHSYGVSFACRADDWPTYPARWRTAAMNNVAAACRRYAAWIGQLRGVDIPARRITVAQARAGTPGFISHGELDPGRRHDPWNNLTWQQEGALWGQLLNAYDAGPSEVPPTRPPSTGGNATVAVNLRVLRQGMTGGDVKSLQALLREKAGQAIVDDGQFGPATDRAVRNVQRFFRLADDGIVGARTWPCLFL